MQEDFKRLAHYYMSLVDGDTHLLEEAFALLRKHGLVDEYGFEIEDKE